MKKYFFIIIVGLIIVILAVGFWFYFFRQPKEVLEEKKEVVSPEVQAGFGSEVFEKAGENPAGKLPETNPFQKDINPLEGVYKNPFE